VYKKWAGKFRNSKFSLGILLLLLTLKTLSSSLSCNLSLIGQLRKFRATTRARHGVRGVLGFRVCHLGGRGGRFKV
jgi:hypothetical protein